MRRATVVLAVVLAAGCADLNGPRGPETQVVSPADIVMAVGEEVRVDGLLRLSFEGVPSDSRCPLGVMCIWSGDGAVAITHGLGMGPSLPDTLHTNLDPQAVSVGWYRITLLELMPHPIWPDPIPADSYTVRLRVERIAYPQD
jgi:hypothetical protein